MSGLEIQRSPSPFNEVRAGQVQALIPDDWQPVPATNATVGEGFWASPDPRAWARMDGAVAGISATWVDATRIGVPSDFYYLAATGPALGLLTHSVDCRAVSRRVYANNRPAWISGHPGSPGDFVARGEGTCDVQGAPTRWAYFVAAPGFGPARAIGIPSSGLYLVVAVLPDTQHAPVMLRKLLDGARFGDAGVQDFLRAFQK